MYFMDGFKPTLPIKHLQCHMFDITTHTQTYILQQLTSGMKLDNNMTSFMKMDKYIYIIMEETDYASGSNKSRWLNRVKKLL